MPQQQAPAPVQEVFRLSPQAYEALEKAMPKPGSTANPIEAGYLLGIQYVLKTVRDGFTVMR